MGEGKAGENLGKRGGCRLREPVTSLVNRHSTSLSSCISLFPGIQFHPRILWPWWWGISNYVEKTRENHQVWRLCSNWLKYNYRKCGKWCARGVHPSLDWKRATEGGVGPGGSGSGSEGLGSYSKTLQVGVSPVGLGVKWPFHPGSSSSLSCDPGPIISLLCSLICIIRQ